MIPRVLWSQDNEGHVCFAFQLIGGKDLEYKVEERKLTFSARDNDDKSYHVILNLFDAVDTDDHKSLVYGREIVIVLTKKNIDGGFWKQPLSDIAKPSFIKTDFRRMHGEGSDDNEKSDDDQFGKNFNFFNNNPGGMMGEEDFEDFEGAAVESESDNDDKDSSDDKSNSQTTASN